MSLMSRNSVEINACRDNCCRHGPKETGFCPLQPLFYVIALRICNTIGKLLLANPCFGSKRLPTSLHLVLTQRTTH